MDDQKPKVPVKVTPVTSLPLSKEEVQAPELTATPSKLTRERSVQGRGQVRR